MHPNTQTARQTASPGRPRPTKIVAGPPPTANSYCRSHGHDSHVSPLDARRNLKLSFAVWVVTPLCSESCDKSQTDNDDDVDRRVDSARLLLTTGVQTAKFE